MFWNIAIAVVAALAQAISSWLGYRVSTALVPLTIRQRRWHHLAFILCAAVGIVLVGISASHSVPERAHFAFSFEPTNHPISYSSSDNLWSMASSIFPVGQPLSYNVSFKNVGSGPSTNTGSYCRSYLEPDQSLSSNRDAVAKLDAWIKTQPAPSGNTIAKDQPGAFDTCKGDPLTPEDFSNIVFGRKVIYVVGVWKFEDDLGHHYHNICVSLQPPQPGGGLILAGCQEHTEEK
jgi:hypothetical protein